MFGVLDKLINTTINTVATVASPVTELVGLDKRKVVALLALGWTVYEISELTGIAQDVIESLKE